MFVHFTKHYRVSGIGIKHLVDLWVYKKEKPLLDWQYIESELKKLHLHEFFENVEKTLDVWFNGAAETSETEIISDVVFGSGAYGDAGTAEVSKILRENKAGKSVLRIKVSRWTKILFPSYDRMCEKYAFLKKIPILLPIMWVVRVFDIILFKHNRMSDYIKRQRQLTDKAAEKRREELNAVGLDFYFEE